MKTIRIVHTLEIPINFTGKVEWFLTGKVYCVDYLVNGKLHSLVEPARKYMTGKKTDLYSINGEFITENIKEFFKSEKYKLAKKQHDLLEAFKKIKDIK